MKMPRVEIMLLLGMTIFGCCTTSQESEWTWRDGDKREARYATSQFDDDFDEGLRPLNPGPFGPNSGPILPAQYKNDDPGILVGPGGPTGIVTRPAGHRDLRLPHSPEYSTCKCSYSFNCPDLVFGSCGKGKRYCCYNSNKFHGAPPAHYPMQRPSHFGPDFSPPTSNYGKPHYNGGYQFPGHYYRNNNRSG